MTNEITDISSSFWTQINKASKILINIHIVSDLDSIGSALGFKNVLEGLNKKVTVFSPEKIAPERTKVAKNLVGFDDILYQDLLDIELSQFDLFLCLDCGGPSRVSRNPDLKFPLTIPTLMLDHHGNNPLFGNTNFVIPSGHCTSEILYWLCQEKNITISKEAAHCFFAGIITDTDRFRFPNVTSSDSFRAAADLIDIGQINFPILCWDLDSKSSGTIEVIGQIHAQARSLFSGKVMLSKLVLSDLQRYGVDPESMKTIYRVAVDSLSYSEDSPIVILIYELQPDFWGISIRTDNPHLDAWEALSIAKQFPGGGGHPRGAGATMSGTYDQVESALIKIISETYPSLGQP